MDTAKDEIKTLINRLPDNCTFEDMQYQLYAAEKIKKGITRAKEEGKYTQQEVEGKFSKWINP